MSLAQWSHFSNGDPLKTFNVRHHLQEIGFKAFPLNDKLCIVNAIRTYLDLTHNQRTRPDQSRLLLTSRKPFGPASKATITTRLVRDVMRESEISDDLFTAYSVWSASTSKDCRAGMAWESLRKVIGWRCESTFTKHYKKTIFSVGVLGKTILQSYTNN